MVRVPYGRHSVHTVIADKVRALLEQASRMGEGSLGAMLREMSPVARDQLASDWGREIGGEVQEWVTVSTLAAAGKAAAKLQAVEQRAESFARALDHITLGELPPDHAEDLAAEIAELDELGLPEKVVADDGPATEAGMRALRIALNHPLDADSGFAPNGDGLLYLAACGLLEYDAATRYSYGVLEDDHVGGFVDVAVVRGRKVVCLKCAGDVDPEQEVVLEAGADFVRCSECELGILVA